VVHLASRLVTNLFKSEISFKGVASHLKEEIPTSVVMKEELIMVQD